MQLSRRPRAASVARLRLRDAAKIALAVLGPLLALHCAGSDVGPQELDARPPGRIVSLTPAITEILFALDLGDRVVGVTDYCDYPPEVTRVARVGGYVNPSVEAILALRPDLALVTPAAGNRDAALAVRRAGVRLEVVPAGTLDETYTAIETIASLCGARERGSRLARTVRERVEAASERVRSRPPVRVLFCLQVDPIIAAGVDTLPAELLVLAGGSNIVGAKRYPRIGIETVLAEEPEVILQARMDRADSARQTEEAEFWKRWPSLPAVRDGRVFVIDGATALRPGPRVADAVERLAALLHPPQARGPS